MFNEVPTAVSDYQLAVSIPILRLERSSTEPRHVFFDPLASQVPLRALKVVCFKFSSAAWTNIEICRRFRQSVIAAYWTSVSHSVPFNQEQRDTRNLPPNGCWVLLNDPPIEAQGGESGESVECALSAPAYTPTPWTVSVEEYDTDIDGNVIAGTICIYEINRRRCSDWLE